MPNRTTAASRRATRRGDILTVVIEIDDSAEIKNSTGRSRSGSEKMGVPSLFGVPESLNRDMTGGATMDSAVDTSSSSSYKGDGSVKRNEGTRGLVLNFAGVDFTPGHWLYADEDGVLLSPVALL